MTEVQLLKPEGKKHDFMFLLGLNCTEHLVALGLPQVYLNHAWGCVIVDGDISP